MVNSTYLQLLSSLLGFQHQELLPIHRHRHLYRGASPLWLDLYLIDIFWDILSVTKTYFDTISNYSVFLLMSINQRVIKKYPFHVRTLNSILTHFIIRVSFKSQSHYSHNKESVKILRAF